MQDDMVFSEVKRSLIIFKKDVLDCIGSMSDKPQVSEITPPSLLLLKLFHTNVLPHKSGRNKVTYQDFVLLSVFVQKVPCDLVSLIIKNMSHCSSHESMHLPHPTLLTKVFQYFCIFSGSDKPEKLVNVFDLSTLLNNTEVFESNELMFGSNNVWF